MCFATFAAFAILMVGTIISKGCECQGTSLCSAQKFSRMYFSMSDAPSSKSAARLATTPNFTRMRRPSICWCYGIPPPELIGCLFALLSIKRFQCLMHNFRVGCTTGLQTRFGPAPVSFKQLNGIIPCNPIPTRTILL